MKTSIFILAMLGLMAALPSTILANHLDGGFVSFGGGSLVIADTSHHHHSFSHQRNLAFVDDSGAVVDYHTLWAGYPTTVHYSGHGNHRVATRVVVHPHRHGHH